MIVTGGNNSRGERIGKSMKDLRIDKIGDDDRYEGYWAGSPSWVCKRSGGSKSCEVGILTTLSVVVKSNNIVR